MVHHSFSLHIGFHYKSNCSHLKKMETERFYYFIMVCFFDRLKKEGLTTLFINYLLLPRKNRAMVPGPEWEPITPPM